MKFTVTRKILVMAIVCAAFASGAFGESRVISKAYEAPLQNFQAPQSMNGLVTFRECPDCDILQFHVTAATRYAVNGRTVELEDFRLALLQSGDRIDGSVTVLHHLESDRVKAVDAWL